MLMKSTVPNLGHLVLDFHVVSKIWSNISIIYSDIKHLTQIDPASTSLHCSC